MTGLRWAATGLQTTMPPTALFHTPAMEKRDWSNAYSLKACSASSHGPTSASWMNIQRSPWPWKRGEVSLICPDRQDKKDIPDLFLWLTQQGRHVCYSLTRKSQRSSGDTWPCRARSPPSINQHHPCMVIRNGPGVNHTLFVLDVQDSDFNIIFKHLSLNLFDSRENRPIRNSIYYSLIS